MKQGRHECKTAYMLTSGRLRGGLYEVKRHKESNQFEPVPNQLHTVRFAPRTGTEPYCELPVYY